MDEIKREEPEMETEFESGPAQKKVSFKNKMMLLAVFGILIGFVIKTEAAKRVTVGFEDYKLLSAEKSYNINDLQKGLEMQKALQDEQAIEAENKALEAAQQEAPEGAEKTTCGVDTGETCQ